MTRGCMQNMKDLILRIIELEDDFHEVDNLIDYHLDELIAKGIIEQEQKKETAIVWLTMAVTYREIGENLFAQELLNFDQKEYIWSIITGALYDEIQP